MPCGDNGESDHYRKEERLQAATRVACELWKILKEHSTIAVTANTAKWIIDHEAADLQREAKERSNAL